ncbi:hypothetical protein [Tissierella praeacuta]|uniref:hypothetical protein n=1 Tax=Tissierella praeacuta TaxID=43131 RepID=UPI002FD9357D
MKFEKFVKSLGVNGVIHERKNGDRWISGFSASMKIPENVKGVMGKVIAEMPDVIEEYIKYELSAVPCELFRAYMPEADSAIKDCIRVFKTQDNQYECGIRNNDFALIEKSDVVEMYIGTNSDTFESEPKVLLIKRFTTDIKDPELVGLILPHKFD